MRVRHIFWYRTEEEWRSNNLYILDMYEFPLVGWCCYSFMDTLSGSSTRKEFEKDYLEWGDQNEG